MSLLRHHLPGGAGDRFVDKILIIYSVLRMSAWEKALLL